MERPIKHSWQAFIDAFIETGDHIAAYLRAYPGVSRQVAATKGRALLKRPIIAEAVAKIHNEKSRRIAEVRDGHLTEAERQTVMSELELDLLLSQIARGDIRVPKVISGRTGVSVEVMVAPDISDRITAIDKLYKRYGSYTQDKPSPAPLPSVAEMSNEELKALLKKDLELLFDDEPEYLEKLKAQHVL